MALIDKIPVFSVGLNHRTAPVGLLEQASICRDALTEEVTGALGSATGPTRAEILVLSTCNRFELYWAFMPQAHQSDDVVLSDIAERVVEIVRATVGAHDVPDAIYTHQGRDVWEHLFRVSSGLNSAVLGEFEIQGQVAAAFAEARASGSAGPILSEMFESALRCGKRARAETAVGKNASSVSSVAVQLAGNVVGDLSGSCAVVVGAGQTGELTLKALSRRGLGEVHVVNRTLENASRVAAGRGATAHTFSSLSDLIPKADIVITAASTPEPLVTREIVSAAMASRPHRPLVIIDIAVPRNVCPEVTSLQGVHLFDVDAIKSTVDENAREREREVPRVEHIIEEELADSAARVGEIFVRPVLAGLWQRAEGIREDVVEQARKSVTGMPDDQWTLVDRITRSLMKRLLHTPARRLRDEAADEGATTHAAAIEYLFDLDPVARVGRQRVNESN